MPLKASSRLDLILAAAIIAALMGFIERGHSIVIDPPDQVQLAPPALEAAPSEPPMRETSCANIGPAPTGEKPTIFSDELFVSGLLGQPMPAALWFCERE